MKPKRLFLFYGHVLNIGLSISYLLFNTVRVLYIKYSFFPQITVTDFSMSCSCTQFSTRCYGHSQKWDYGAAVCSPPSEAVSTQQGVGGRGHGEG